MYSKNKEDINICFILIRKILIKIKKKSILGYIPGSEF